MSDSIKGNNVSSTNPKDEDQATSDSIDNFNHLETTPNIISKDEIQTSSPTQSSKESDYEIGDIVWAKVGRYPFWPSVICMDPESKTFTKSNENKKNINVHVRFCNDKGKRSWVKNIERYRGKDELLLKYPYNLSYVKNRDILKNAWNKAVEDADNLMKLERELRAITFFKTFSNSNPFDVSSESDLNTSSKSSTKTRKRKLNKNQNDPSNSSEGPLFIIGDKLFVPSSSSVLPVIPEKRKCDIRALEESYEFQRW